MRNKLIATLLVIVTIFSFTGCGGSSSQTDKTTKDSSTGGSVTEEAGNTSTDPTEAAQETVLLRIALPTWVGYGPLYVAQEKDFFGECGIEVELSIVEGLAERKQALASGKLDGLATAADVFVNLNAVDIPIGIVWVLDRSNGADGIVATSDVKSPADLKGKTIATEIGTTEHLFLLRVLEQYELTGDDIDLLPMTIGEAGAAFVAGKVDAAVTYDPYLAQGIEAGGIAFTTAEYNIDLVDAIGFTNDVIENNPDAIQSFVKAMSMAADYIAQNSVESYGIMAKGLKLEEKDVTDTIAKLECYDLKGNLEQMGTEENPGKIYETTADEADFYLEQTIIEKEPDINSMIAPQFVRSLSD